MPILTKNSNQKWLPQSQREELSQNKEGIQNETVKNDRTLNVGSSFRVKTSKYTGKKQRRLLIEKYSYKKIS